MAFVTVTGSAQTTSIPSEPYAFEEKGQALTGRLLDKVEIQTQYGPKMKYVVETSEGNKSILGSFQLDEKLSKVTTNETVRITFLGREKTKNGKVKLFNVEVDR